MNYIASTDEDEIGATEVFVNASSECRTLLPKLPKLRNVPSESELLYHISSRTPKDFQSLSCYDLDQQLQYSDVM